MLLVLALAHGLAYVFLLPVWQHYDEPNHFEYAWLSANLGRLPEAGEYDSDLSRRVVESMLAHGFYEGMDSRPELGSGDEPIKIGGYSQLGEPPFYYLLASIPLRMMGACSVEKQLYAARLVSLALFLLVVLVGWGTARELTSTGHPLRWMAPGALAMFPGFVELMTAVNNDALAVLMFSLFFWGSVRLIRRGLSLLGLLWVLAAAALTYFSKNTAMIALLLLPVVLLFAIVRGRWRPLAWGILVMGLAAISLISLSWDDALYWYRATSQAVPARLPVVEQARGDYALGLETQARTVPSWSAPLFQPLPPEVALELQGKRVALGAWMWASQAAVVNTPIFRTSAQAFSKSVVVDEMPRFYAFDVEVPENAELLWVYLEPKFSGDAAAWVYYDGLVLAEGEWPLLEEPHFSTPQGAQGEWGGMQFTNLIRNGPAESAGPRVTPWIDNLATRFLPDQARPSQILLSLVDVQGAWWLYELSIQQVFETFWARFGWGHVPLIWKGMYGILAVITLAGVAGAIVGALRRGRRLQWDVAAFAGGALLLSWGMTVTRGSVYLALGDLYLPVARHSYPVIIPTVLVLNAGWLEIGCWVRLARRRLGRIQPDVTEPPGAVGAGADRRFAAYLAIFLIFDLICMASIARYYALIG